MTCETLHNDETGVLRKNSKDLFFATRQSYVFWNDDCRRGIQVGLGRVLQCRISAAFSN